jgi:hypothetical protein
MTGNNRFRSDGKCRSRYFKERSGRNIFLRCPWNVMANKKKINTSSMTDCWQKSKRKRSNELKGDQDLRADKCLVLRWVIAGWPHPQEFPSGVAIRFVVTPF